MRLRPPSTPVLVVLALVGRVLLDPPVAFGAQDAAAVSPDIYKVEIENQWVRVLRVKLAPHQVSKPHTQSAGVAVLLTDVHATVTNVGGGNVSLDQQAGQVINVNAATQPRVEENVSDQPIELILVELKPGAPPSPPIALDVVKLDPEHHPVVLENDRVRVLRTILEPHLKSPMHEHPHYVVVYLTELHTTMKMADGREVDNPRKPGEVAWRDALKHQTEQMGDKTAVEIQIELK
jgi:quercetin dioxygenase-like cupin family protein